VSCRFLGHRDTLIGLSVYVESLHGAPVMGRWTSSHHSGALEIVGSVTNEGVAATLPTMSAAVHVHDRELLHRTRAGDAEAFGAFYRARRGVCSLSCGFECAAASWPPI
jgi:hypothetical protein